MNSFRQASEIEKQAEAVLLPYMEKTWPGCVYYATRHHPLVQKFDGDFLVKRCGNAKYIEIKAERKHTGNLFIETWSNKQRKTLGWFHVCQADWLWYFFLDNNSLYVVPMNSLREWARGSHYRLLQFNERKQQAYSQLNDTWGRLVPIDVLKNECPAFRGPFLIGEQAEA